MHSDADVDRSLSRDPCWTFRSQSSVFHFLESLGFDPQSFHVTIDGIKTRQYCSRANVFFFLDPVTSEKTIKENLSQNIINIRKAELIHYTCSGVRFSKTRRRPKAFTRNVLVEERITGMFNGNGSESWVVCATNVCRRDWDVLLRTNTLEDKLHTRVPLLLKTKLTSVLPPYMLGVWGSSLKFAFFY